MRQEVGLSGLKAIFETGNGASGNRGVMELNKNSI